MTYKPRPFTVIEVGNGAYTAREPCGDVVCVPSPDDFNDLHTWTLELNDTQLEAALQMFWDRWVFQSGENCDKLAFEALDAERRRRKLPTSTFAPGIFTA